ncbi:30S ribosomal protein S2 [Limisphaera ngatamarikiensis]|uniref:Small ribosomal subunit protein uS2 n=1 Tax=Limisphaera ngatamarikiensis TaxID=1324935 RepID=A0A6M1RSS7_9BACT|nr:30S ribosomal protein S2 [Limisphaera ngatamarikiensis]
MLSIGIKELLDAGVHFGHQTRRWNPKMKPYIFDARNGIHIIDLSKTLAHLESACSFLREVVLRGDRIIFVGTKKQAQQVIRDTAKECGQFWVTERWLGGTLTNFVTIRRSMGRLDELEKLETSGAINNYVKQEQSRLRREAARLRKYFEGIRGMDRLPGAVFVVDTKREHNAVAEARKKKIPVVAIVDTNCDPDEVDYPIPGNDDAIRSIRLILGVVAQTILQARAEFESRQARRGEGRAEAGAAAGAAAAAESPAASGVAEGAAAAEVPSSAAATPVEVAAPASGVEPAGQETGTAAPAA